MKITVLVENSRLNKSVTQAHGLSLLIEDQQQQFLFDSGPNKKIIANAQQLQVNLNNLHGIILSHGHADHAGGLRYLPTNQTPLYLSKDALAAKYIQVFKTKFYVGLPKKIPLTKFKLNYITEKTAIADKLYLVPLGTAKIPTKNLYVKRNNKIALDTFEDEVMLIKELADEIILFTGCSHHGILNMVETALTLFPNKPIKYLIGGFHLISVPYLNNLNTDKDSIINLGKQLQQLPIKKILTCHCTGKKAYKLLKQVLGEQISEINTGMTLALTE
ncbi:7,8-dihydropterin-6-yl-methyl-4-(beta-D-ribofuranosyl)aminobenzene 5'-phosphate synthase [Enterococcus sp. PF1-24]|uniref:MBL fold metallo-hydrolase n=1 Tax=unclassified Enterococcus TaxID=2608891 RepID=UPI002475A6E6|nr:MULTISPECIES: MBL fold metallo-hydrolase [unclassified Enterococcus]MDH6365092.1 7,8-dihydropterin-6-yl-methyl-4-(beta-D-ribofuranosyl)aminobenzene 5'-phosphate synthase [Enterococcus sp. PFB1-1]MDH6402135.1 7,8-dihydropterin-6-yl-methyl-4-(beta-D-ribofuranosyl)aminobenzene 5'-phosphate synthase [Enterococcus sp. PF1-24]